MQRLDNDAVQQLKGDQRHDGRKVYPADHHEGQMLADAVKHRFGKRPQRADYGIIRISTEIYKII